jgi:hypothetical protein
MLVSCGGPVVGGVTIVGCDIRQRLRLDELRVAGPPLIEMV